ncbi:phosphoglycerate dehydrogenase [Clostridium sp. CCUG 7971]|uniref:phosphoglycerate dehydrogenase n=1 Tax=Clostridium sp. CCUG 7971 TaxID=2811414 RepID=UPI001ABAB3B6|nr:phosphoglycerate dehydrogenase [Clostridium sp. CCUG 7971]MBO3444671.1 phosphoglycerate dehydrogenase [Clostridium sp. CCUG 7971]
MKVLFTHNYGEEKFQKIRDLGYEVTYYKESKIQNNEDTDSADVLVTYNPFKTLDISKINNLKYIQTSSVGVDQVPKEEVLKRNIVLANNKGAYSIPISEWIIMYILQIYKNSMKLYSNQQNRKWKIEFDLLELYDKRVGFIGTGTIATEAAKRLKAFGVEVWGVNTKGTDKEYFDRCFSSENMNDVFKECDVIVSTIPATKSTIGMINKDKFSIMKDKSIFINIGRGNIVNENDLIDCIDKFRGVALDVFEKEPLSKDSKLWDFENVIITPHNSWISDKDTERTFNVIYNNLKNYIENKPLNNVVDILKGY